MKLSMHKGRFHVQVYTKRTSAIYTNTIDTIQYNVQGA